MKIVKDYSYEVQHLFLRIMVTNAELYTRVMSIMNPVNFDRRLKPVAEFIIEHTSKYSQMPDATQIKAVTGIDTEPVPDLNDGHYDWFLEEFESFIKRRELERAVLKCADLIEKGEGEQVEKVIKDAVQISLQKDIGISYFDDPRARLMLIKSSNGQHSTGWPTLDRAIYGGFNRGELNVFCGGSGSGKSLILQNLAINWAEAGLNGAYVTLELSEGFCSMRMDSMVSSVSSRDIFKNIDTVELKVRMFAKTAGKLQLKYLPAQSTVNDVRSYCKELQIQTGIKIDFLCVDYIDLLMPSGIKVNPSDAFTKDKYVSEELRNLCKELNAILVSASQLNRSSVDEIEFDHSHIAGGISKINTADNVFGIFTSRSMRERGKYQLQLMKTRSSSGVGKKIELDFDVETLRITDPDEEDDTTANAKPSMNQTLANLKTFSTIIDKDTGEILQGLTESGDLIQAKPPVKVDVQSTRLRQLINELKPKDK